MKKTQEVAQRIFNEIAKKQKDVNSVSCKSLENLNKYNDFNRNITGVKKEMSCNFLKEKELICIRMTAQIKDIFEKLRCLGYVHPYKDRAISNVKLQIFRDDEIVLKYNSIIRGLLTWYSGAYNFIKVKGIALLLRISCVLTLANKHKKNMFWVYRKYGNSVKIFREVDSNGTINLITRHQVTQWKSGFNLTIIIKSYKEL
jgi:hypothetical protein